MSSAGTFSYGDRIVTANACDFLRMAAEWPRSSPIDLAIRNIILSALYSSETKMGGSGIISAMLLSGDVEIISETRKPKYSDVSDVIDTWAPRGISRKIAKEIFMMGACGSEVVLSEGNQWGTKVSCVSGTVQKGTVDNLMLGKLGVDYNCSTSAFVVAIDGIVESLGHIHKLLESTEGAPLVIMAKGFLPDVTNTLAANYPQKLKCIPFVVQDWCLESFLRLRDLGVTCVSSETGDMIEHSILGSMVNINISSQEVILHSEKNQKRKIEVSFGKDLDSLKGVSLDRTKLLLALTRFTSRTGVMKLSYNGKTFTVPKSSYMAAKKCHESLAKIFENLGAIVTLSQRKTNNGKS